MLFLKLICCYSFTTRYLRKRQRHPLMSVIKQNGGIMQIKKRIWRHLSFDFSLNTRHHANFQNFHQWGSEFKRTKFIIQNTMVSPRYCLWHGNTSFRLIKSVVMTSVMVMYDE